MFFVVLTTASLEHASGRHVMQMTASYFLMYHFFVELLLFSIVMMHISLVTSMPVGSVGSVGSCDRIRKEMVLPLCNLWQAEKAYVSKHIIFENYISYNVYS